MRAHRNLALAFFLALGFSHVSALDDPPASPAPEARSELPDELSKLQDVPMDDFWQAIEGMKKTYQSREVEAVASLSEKVFSLAEKAKLAGGVLLLSRGERRFQGSGQVALQQLAHTGKEKAVRIAAIRLLGNPPRVEPAYLVLKGILDSPEETEIRIEACLALWSLDNHHSVLAPLVRMLEHEEAGARFAAALALAETGYFQPPVDEILRALRQEPSDRGKRADLLLRLLE